MRHRNRTLLREKLAAEYVLGTLRGGAKRRFEGWLHHDAALRAIAAQWQDRLLPLAQLAAEMAPPVQLWQRIERGLGLGHADTVWAFRQGPPQTWRGAARAASTAIVALLAMDLNAHALAGPTVTRVSAMTLAGSETALLLIADSRQHCLHVRMVGHAIGNADLSMQLWAVSGQGRTRSLGVLDGYAELKVALPAAPHDADVAILAVSLEPKGGSRDPDRPTGPILYQGNWMNLMQD